MESIHILKINLLENHALHLMFKDIFETLQIHITSNKVHAAKYTTLTQ